MVSETKSSNGGNAGGGGFRAKMDHVLYSGEKKHVFAGILIIGAVFAVPWFLMTRGSKQQSHQDYLEKADKARSERLSTSKAK
ncbi:hypothetical protein RHGRI_024737 [Rhododendron griersonianum]|uniref:GAG1At protein n=1 Tax=Rhododendron griersonianum TaxID=479676 RepID=A0AAV6J8K2_9ERIC|nr:hypothetical protein RHGRI_024737 [Rhododendron griersonianum]